MAGLAGQLLAKHTFLILAPRPPPPPPPGLPPPAPVNRPHRRGDTRHSRGRKMCLTPLGKMMPSSATALMGSTAWSMGARMSDYHAQGGPGLVEVGAWPCCRLTPTPSCPSPSCSSAGAAPLFFHMGQPTARGRLRRFPPLATQVPAEAADRRRKGPQRARPGRRSQPAQRLPGCSRRRR